MLAIATERHFKIPHPLLAFQNPGQKYILTKNIYIYIYISDTTKDNSECVSFISFQCQGLNGLHIDN